MISFQKMYKNQRIIWLTMLVLVLIVSGISEEIVIGSKHQISLNAKNSFQAQVEVRLTEDKLKEFLQINNSTKEKNWFIFFDIEPANEVSWPDIYINIFTQQIKNKTKLQNIRQCSKQGLQLQTCYLSNQDFNLTEQTLLVQIGSDQEVKILFLSEFMLMKKLQLNFCTKIDSSSMKSNSKLFKINIKQIAVKFEEIRISLTPINKIYGGQGLNLYGSFGQYFPTADKHDFTSFYAWEMGVVAVLQQRRLVQVDWVYILVDYPPNYLFDLDTTLIEDFTKPIELKTAEYYDDIIAGVHNQRTFIFNIDHPQLNNYIRIKKYHGSVIIENVSAIQYKQIVGTRRYQDKITDYSNEFQLSSQEFKIGKGIKKLQVKLKTKSFYNVAVYTIETYQNSKEYNWIMDGQTHLAQLMFNQKNYFVSRAIRHQNQLSSLSEAFIRVTTLKGKVSQRVFICLVPEVEKCFDFLKNSTSQKIINKDGLLIEIQDLKSVQVGLQSRKEINLNLSKSHFINHSEGYKQQIIMIEMTGDQKSKDNVFSIEFMNVGIMDTLTEHESKTEKLQEEEFKIYRFTVPNDTQVHALTFHVTKLYGFVSKFVTDIDPSSKSQQELKSMLESQPIKYVKEYEDSIQIETIQPLKTYYLVIFAKFRAMITIKVQLKKFMSHPTDQRNISYSIFLINTLTSYSLTFSPGQLIILDFNQIKTPLVFLKGQALLPLDVCINLHHTGEKDLIPLQPKCQFRHKLGKKYEINLHLQIIQRQIGLYNGNNETVLLSLSLENQQKCVERTLGDRTFFSGALFSELKTKQLCLKMRLFKKGTLIVSYKPKSPLLHRLLRLSYMIGKTQGRQLTRYETIIDSQEVEIGCNRTYEQCYISLIGYVNEEGDINETTKALKDQEIVFEVQYIDEPIDLFDGVQFTYMGPLSAQAPLRFKYSIFSVNQPVRLTLQKQIGSSTVLAKVANRRQHYLFPQQKDLQNSQPKAIQANQSSVIYRASNQIFYLYETIIISSQELKKHCVSLEIEHYKACTLLISVFPLANQKKYVNPESKFTIEVVQHIYNLKQSEPVPGYLEPLMTNVYEMENSIENSTIIVYVSSNAGSNNLNCFRMDARLISVNQSDDDKKYYSKRGEHTLIINNAVKGRYSLKLKGVQSSQKYCDYILQFSVVPPSKQGEKEVIGGPIMTLKRSTPFRLQMEEKKTDYFMFYNHGRLSNFKVLTLFQKLGDVLISVMPFASSEQQRNMITHMKDIDSLFKPEWKDSNTVEIYESDKAYCGQCLYVIKIECLKAMKGSIIVPQASQQIYMSKNDFVYDQLLQGQKSFYSIYVGFEFIIKMQLISGEVSIKVKNKEDNKYIFNKNFTSTKQQIIEKIKNDKNSTYQYKMNCLIEITSLVNAHFTLTLSQTNKQPVAEKKKNMVLGVPISMIVAPTVVQQCVTGLMEQEPTFILTQLETFFATPKASQLLKFQFWVKSSKTNSKTQIPNQNFEINKTSNSLLLKIKSNEKTQSLFDHSNTFDLCFSTTNPISFDIIQTSHVNYLPSNADILINKNINFTFMAGEDNILEINECKGNSWISISQSFGSIHSLESQISQIRRPNSLIEFQHKGPIFLTVESDGIMSINWKNVDLKKGKNTGYEMYDAGSFRIIPTSNPSDNLQIQILPLKDFSLSIIPKQTLPLFNDLVYEIYVEKQEGDLSQAMNCHVLKGIKKQQRVRYEDFKEKKMVELQSINELKQRFPDSEFVLVSVKAMLQMKNKVTGQIQKYRFFYPFQEIVLFEKDLMSVGQQADQSGKITYFLIGMFATAILIVLLIVFCGKNIRNYMDKLRRRKINQQNHFQLKSEVTQTDHDRHYQKAIDV